MVTTSVAPWMRWFAPPELPSPEATRRARAFWLIEWSFLAILTALLTMAVIVTPETLTRRGTSILLVAALVGILHIANRRGRTEAASWVMVLGLTVIVTQRAWHTGGIHSSVALFYVVFILMSAGLLGVRGSVVTALACLASAGVLTGAEIVGVIAPPASQEPIALAVLKVVLGIAASLLTLNLLLRQAQRAASDDLIQMFVHDMRSPLTVIMARLTMLRDEAADDSETASHADGALGDAMRLNRLANTLLDIHRLDAGRMPLKREATDIAKLARSVVRAMQVMEPGRQLEVRAPVAMTWYCDPELIRRVIENLVSNAMKHSPSRGRIWVDVEQTPDWMRIAVQDEGSGIPLEARARVFERYSATRATTPEGRHSVGLGLAFCQLAVGAHGGTLRIESAEPQGSIFVVELPNSSSS